MVDANLKSAQTMPAQKPWQKNQVYAIAISMLYPKLNVGQLVQQILKGRFDCTRHLRTCLLEHFASQTVGTGPERGMDLQLVPRFNDDINQGQCEKKTKQNQGP